MGWLRDLFKDTRPVCVHCNETKTDEEFEGSPTCWSCERDILEEREFAAEKKYNCPECGAEMKKAKKKGIIVDKCPKCKGVYLNAGELKSIINSVRSSSENDGFASGFVLGLVID